MAVKLVCCAAGATPGESSTLSFSSLCSWRRRISRARTITSLGKSGQPRHFDPVAFVRAAGLDAPQKHDLVARFVNRYVYVLHAGQQLLEFGELMIMRGKKRPGPGASVQRFDYRPGDGKPVEGSRATAYFIE